MSELRDGREAPPIRVWVAVAALLLSVTTAYALAAPATHRAMLEKVTERLGRERQGELVLVLGNSLSCAAIDAGVRRLDDGRVVDIRILPFRLTRFTTVDEVAAMATRLGAALLLVQEDFRFTPVAGRYFTNERLHLEWGWLLRYRGEDPEACRSHLDAPVELTPGVLQGLVAKYSRPDTPPNYSAVADFIRLEKPAFGLAMIRVPRAPSFEAAMPYLVANREQVERRLGREGLPVSAPIDVAWQDGHFGDYRHMNARGAAVYTRWLVDELPQLLALPR